MKITQLLRTTFCRGISGAGILLLTVIASKLYGESAAGTINLIWATMIFTSMFCKFGFDFEGMKKVSIYLEMKSALELAAFLNGTLKNTLSLFILAIPILLAVNSWLNFNEAPSATANLLLIGAYLFYTLNSFLLPVLRGLGKPDASFLLDQGAIAVLVMIALIVLKANTLNIETLALIILASSFSVLFLTYIYTIRETENATKAKLRIRPTIGLPSLSKSTPYFAVSLCEFSIFWAGLFFLRFNGETENTGIYSLLLRAAQISVILMAIIGSITSPRLAAMFSNTTSSDQDISIYLSHVYKVNFMAGLIGILSSILIVTLFIQQDIVELSQSTATCFLLLTLPQALKVFLGPVNQILVMSKSEAPVLARFSFYGVTTTLAASILTIPHYGIVGAAFAYAAGLSFYNLCSLFHIRRTISNAYPFNAQTVS